MTSAENPPARSLTPSSPDLPAERAVTYATLSAEMAGTLGSLLSERLSGIDVMYATPSQSLDAMRAASLTADLLVQALTADPEALAAVSGFRGPIDTMASAAERMHSHQTGHSLPRAHFNWSAPQHQETLAVLEVIKDKAEDRRWDDTHEGSREAEPTTAVGRRDIALEAVRGLGLIAERRGQALVSLDTADQVVAYLGRK